MTDTLPIIALALAAPPAALFAVNLAFYRRLAAPTEPAGESISVLIPARNEELNISATLEAVLANPGDNFEVLILDDHSTDRTVEIVQAFVFTDSRVRLETAPPLPAGWCGKQHACYHLARLARNPLLLFIDADVRLAPGALRRLAHYLKNSNYALASGIPRQEMGTFSERLLLPLIHFVLLGYLPMPVMYWTTWPGFSAGCGQLMAVRRDAYALCGGHAQIRDSLHDGLKLPRVFRRAGFRTGLFDATDMASCRMYHSHLEIWRGLGKNAIEGLAAPGIIGPMTVFLLGGQVLPFVLLAWTPLLSRTGVACVLAAVVLALAPRLIIAWRFRQPPGSTWLHAAGVSVLVAIQWHALCRFLHGKPAMWKNRRYPATKARASKPL
ncbi:MAG TPA: glycosyltransferase family 2 protein [Alphaproteobacteria bacterium]|nr:glycosyltransferase family 2 protein [Alphaproteobacteria bacterium]